MYSISFSADQNYLSPFALGSQVFENAKQVTTQPLRLVNAYAWNTSGNTVYLVVADSADGGTTFGRASGVIYPIAAGSYVAVSKHGGTKMSKGLWVKAFTDLALTTAAGNVMFYNFDWMDYV